MYGVDSCHHEIDITAINRELSCHTSKYLDADKAISIPIGECVLNNILDNGYEALSLLPHRVLEKVDLLDLVLHLLLELIKEKVVPLGVQLLAGLTLLKDHHVCLLLLALLQLLDLLLLLDKHLLVQLREQVLDLLVEGDLRNILIEVIVHLDACLGVDPAGGLLLFLLLVFVGPHFFCFLFFRFLWVFGGVFFGL